MNAALRRRHRSATTVLAVGLPLAFAAALGHGAARERALDGGAVEPTILSARRPATPSAAPTRPTRTISAGGTADPTSQTGGHP